MRAPTWARARLIVSEKDLKALKSMLDETAFEDEIFGAHVRLNPYALRERGLREAR